MRHPFEPRAARIDGILGTLCGHLLAAMVWASVLGAVALLAPDTLCVQGADHIGPGSWHEREALFLDDSQATVTTIGYGDVTPVAPAARSAAMLEGVFGQFCLAVVVGELAG